MAKVRIKKVPYMKSGGSLSAEKAREILHDGTIHGKSITDKQRRYFGYISGGGKSKADNGASITQLSSNPTSQGIFQFNGASHKNGGIPIKYANQGVEVEGDETGFIDQNNDLNVFGNLQVPGTNKKFKSISKDIAKQENKTNKQLDKSMKLINEADPYDPIDKFKFNSGMLMAKAAQTKQKELSSLKENLAKLQENMLGMAQSNGMEPQAMWGKAEYGTKMQDGGKRKSLAQRHNNPGNIMYAPWQKKYGAVPGEKRISNGKEIGSYAQFPSVAAGQQAIVALLKDPTYKGKTVEGAIKRWTGGEPYQNIPASIRNKKVSDLNDNEFGDLLNTITVGEDSKKYNWEGVNMTPVGGTPGYTLPTVDVTAPRLYRGYKDLEPIQGVRRDNTPLNINPPSIELENTPQPITPALQQPPTTTTKKKPFKSGLPFSQIAPELAVLATERPDFVPTQRYNPDLFQPYQVSFQDRMNQNQADFNAISRQLVNNPEALSTLAGQKYAANNQIQGEEFRTNQGITNEVTNKNVALLNDAQLKNLELNDQQFVRQEQARVNTRSNIRAAINSISNKYGQNKLQNLQYNALQSSFFPQYTFDQYGRPEYIPNAEQQFGDLSIQGNSTSPAQRTRTTYDKQGNVKQSIVTTPSQMEKTKLEQQLWMNNLKQRASSIRGTGLRI